MLEIIAFTNKYQINPPNLTRNDFRSERLRQRLLWENHQKIWNLELRWLRRSTHPTLRAPLRSRSVSFRRGGDFKSNLRFLTDVRRFLEHL
jgi:hypothetical protein